MPAVSESKYLVTAGWDDVPHLDEKTKRDVLAGTPRYLRDARSRGLPSLGAGAIYPFAVEDVTCAPFPIPAYWPRAYGLDVGWNRTAAVWAAWDLTNDICFLYTEHYMGEERPTTHATAIHARGKWIPGFIDPASRGRAQTDGAQLLVNYRALGLKLVEADNAVEAGIWAMEERFGTGRLKIFTTCQNVIAEYRLYRRDENGKIVKKFDHAMDAARYVVLAGPLAAARQPIDRDAYGAGHAGDGDPGVGY